MSKRNLTAILFSLFVVIIFTQCELPASSNQDTSDTTTNTTESEEMPMDVVVMDGEETEEVSDETEEITDTEAVQTDVEESEVTKEEPVKTTTDAPKEKASNAVVAYRVGFYNVENLFDTKDDRSKKGDDEYLPNSERQWTKKRYDKKISDLAKVIAAMSTPAVLGLCEVENRAVVEDLAADPQLASANYGVVHRESDDYRGIDAALLYNKDLVTIDKVTSKVVKIPYSITKQKSYTTRDILHVEGRLGNDKVHFFVNHWPSRRGGERESSPKREYLAKQLKKMTDAILEKDENANIVIMGDFNDEPINKSITNVLQAKIKDSSQPGELINTSAELDAKGLGSHSYRGNWNLLDQMIVSDAFFNPKATFDHKETVIFKENWMLFRGNPNRTYGKNYYGGFSDHLPTYIDFVRN